MITSLSKPQKFLLPFIGALLIGFMWRVRGDHGFGSMWGMFAVGVALTLFIIVFFSDKMNVRYETVPIAILLLGITNGGWGTLNSQMSGYLSSGVPFSGEEFVTQVEISPYSGLVIMLLLGFGWMPLFAVLIGSLFSDKKFKLRHYILFIGVYYVVMLLCNLSVSHFILQAINSEAVDGFKAGLSDCGYDMSPITAYITNSGSASWAKKIPFGRNYFTSIRVISSAIAAFASALSVRIALKDKITFRIAIGINAVSALAITIADVFMIFDSDRGFLAGVKANDIISSSAWSLWEYFTGFLLGAGITLVLMIFTKNINKTDTNTLSPLTPNEKVNFIYNAVFTLFFTFVLTVARPLGMRIAEWLVEINSDFDEDLFSVLIAVVLGIIGFIPCLLISKKNILDKSLLAPSAYSLNEFAVKALPAYLSVIAVAYFFTGNSDRAYFIHLFTKSFTQGFVTLLMIVSFALFIALYYSATKKQKVK